MVISCFGFVQLSICICFVQVHRWCFWYFGVMDIFYVIFVPANMGIWRKRTTIKITCDLLYYAYLSLRMNSIEQNAHWNGFLSECEYMCCFSDHCFEYSFLQMRQVYFTPKCVSRCRSKWDFCLYRLGH